MRILLDENFPVDFAKLLVGNEVAVTHVHSLGWSGIKNGELLRRAYGVCEVFVTLDRNLEFQQNIRCYLSVLWLYVFVPIVLRILPHTLPAYWRLQAVLRRAKSRKLVPD